MIKLLEGFQDIELAIDSLARERSGIELLNARHDGQRTFATVFVPDGKLLLRAVATEAILAGELLP